MNHLKCMCDYIFFSHCLMKKNGDGAIANLIDGWIDSKYVPKCHSAFWVHTANSFNCRTFHENDNSLTLCKSPSQTVFIYRNGCILNFCQQLNAKQRNEYANIIAYRVCARCNNLRIIFIQMWKCQQWPISRIKSVKLLNFFSSVFKIVCFFFLSVLKIRHRTTDITKEKKYVSECSDYIDLCE